MSSYGIKSLAELRRERAPDTYLLDELPKIVQWTSYAKQKASAINSLVREMYGSSLEWYGFTIGHSEKPQLIVDIGLGENARNDPAYTKIEPEQIGKFCESLPDEYLINGWIHSHGTMGVFFSGTDERNMVNVLDFVTTRLKFPVKKQELLIEDISLLVEGEFSKADLKEGTTTIITDKPIGNAKILETIMGGFSYGMVIIDSGKTGQEIFYKYSSMLTQEEKITHRGDLNGSGSAEIRTIPSKPFGLEDLKCLQAEVKKNIKPDFLSGLWNKFHKPANLSTSYYSNADSDQSAETPVGPTNDCNEIGAMPTSGLDNKVQ